VSDEFAVRLALPRVGIGGREGAKGLSAHPLIQLALKVAGKKGYATLPGCRRKETAIGRTESPSPARTSRKYTFSGGKEAFAFTKREWKSRATFERITLDNTKRSLKKVLDLWSPFRQLLVEATEGGLPGELVYAGTGGSTRSQGTVSYSTAAGGKVAYFAISL